MGKWSKYKLPPLPSSHDDEVGKKMEELSGLSNKEVVEKYIKFRDKKDELKAQLQPVDQVILACEKVLAKRFESEGISSLKTADGDQIGIHPEPHVSVTDMEALNVWADDHDLDRTVPWAKLNAEAKRLLEAGEAQPPGTKLWMRDKVSLRRA